MFSILISSNWRKLPVNPGHMLLLLNLFYLRSSCMSLSSLSTAKIQAHVYLEQILIQEEKNNPHQTGQKPLSKKHFITNKKPSAERTHVTAAALLTFSSTGIHGHHLQCGMLCSQIAQEQENRVSLSILFQLDFQVFSKISVPN